MKNNFCTTTEFNIDDLVHVFEQTFSEKWRTKLIFGASEPFYETAKNHHDFHKIYCRSDFFSSGLHEIAHWCIAGKSRLQIDDYDYWYKPDGRNLGEQKEFEKVEIKPQALEKLFCESINYKFIVSADNLHLCSYSMDEFEKNVALQAKKYIIENNLPPRARLFIEALKKFYKT